MPHDLDNAREAARKGGRRTGQRTARDITNVNRLKTLTADTRVSANLWLQVRGTSRSWVFEKMRDGQRFWIGLGPWPEVSLTAAKDKVAEFNAMLARGEDPRKPAVEHRFRDVVPLWIAKQRPSWTNDRYAKSVPREIAVYTDEIIGDMDVAMIDTPDIYDVLWQDTDNDHPLWLDHNPLARRLRGYVEQVLGYAMAMRWRKQGFNCAVWDDNLEHLLAAPSAIHKPEPHPSLHHEEIGEFMRIIRVMEGMAFRCTDALIQTGLRSNEAIGARWREIDLDRGLWTVPASRMKKRRDHVVALSRQAIALFQSLPRQADLVFGELDDDALRGALAAVFERAGRVWRDRATNEIVVPHGFRASFGTFAGEHGYDNELIDVCLAHSVGSDVLRRYQRGEKAELRRTVMQHWSDYLDL